MVTSSTMMLELLLIESLFRLRSSSTMHAFVLKVILIIHRAYNESLSSRRAQAVANYLINDYGFDPNRFIIVGNGPKNAIRDGVQGSNINYRTTDFMLVTE